MMAGIALHYLECASSSLNNSMMRTLRKNNNDTSKALSPNGSATNIAVMTDDTIVMEPMKFQRPFGWPAVKAIHGLLGGLKYGLSLMLMLVAMSYNPSLFLALMIGYFAGDFMCCDFHLDMKLGVHNTINGGFAGALIRRVLCSKNPLDAQEGESLISMS